MALESPDSTRTRSLVSRVDPTDPPPSQRPPRKTIACVTLSHVSESSVVKSVRLPRDLLDQLVVQAKVEHRTVNNLITAMLTDGMVHRSLANRQARPDETPDTAADSKDTSA